MTEAAVARQGPLAHGNEADVGAEIRRSRVPRDEVFATPGRWNAEPGEGRAPARRLADGRVHAIGGSSALVVLLDARGLRGARGAPRARRGPRPASDPTGPASKPPEPA